MNLNLKKSYLLCTRRNVCISMNFEWSDVRVIFSILFTNAHLDPYLCPEAVVLSGAGWFQRHRGMTPSGPKPPRGLCSQCTGCLFSFLPSQSPRNNKMSMKKNCDSKHPLERSEISLYCQQDYKKSCTATELSTVRTLLTPHITCVLCGSGKLKIRAHH